MRFDDRLQTASVLNDRDVAAVAPQWMHYVDLLAQSKTLSCDERERALAEARRVAPMVPPSIKRSAALAIAARVTSPDLVALFSSEPPRIAAPVILGAMLAADDWQVLIPQLSPPLRALLRERRDLPHRALESLAVFGLSDFALSDERDPATRASGTTANSSVEVGGAGQQTGVSRISDLVARIETWRSRRVAPETNIGISDGADRIEKFHFEANDTGSIIWVAGAPPAAIIGVSLAALADPTCPGVDGQTTGAFAKRADIWDGRMMLPNETPLGGLWLIAARPLFAFYTGKFLGYAGVSRRASDSSRMTSTARASPPEVVRQIVHELRSPLNAICGFAELIEHQIAGPVGQGYRMRATSIVGEAGRMVEMIDTLDSAAKAMESDASSFIAHSAMPETARAPA